MIKLKLKPGLTLAGLVLGVLMQVAPLEAQATRTWVSGVGDDVNPCSRTAPCKTFAGAISKTAVQGQINVLDPGSYGAVTITKAITIDAGGMFAGVLATLNTSAIIVNAGASDIIVLRGLTIDGAGTGGNGIRFLAGKGLYVENCVINNFAQKGIDFEPPAASFLVVTNTVIRNNSNAVNGGGIFIRPSGTGSAKATVDGVTMYNNAFGLRADGSVASGASGLLVDVRNSTASNNTSFGIAAVGGAQGVFVMVDQCGVDHNNTGLQTTGLGATLHMALTTVTANQTGLSGNIVSSGNNTVAGNTTNGSPTSTPGTV